MKCNIRFYIFGVPDGFDIYLENQDDGNTKNYYQCFYDESIKEDTRFAIHRKVNGDVTYTYLKYHLISSGNRTNAFLGLSVLVEKGYYADVSSMYNLLDYACGEMLKRGLLLPMQNGLSAKFTIKTFEERKEDIKSIEAFVLNTLQSSDYAEDFHLLDSTFTNEKPNACLKIPFQIYDDDAKEKELNSLIIYQLKVYSWLSLSPDYQKKEQPPVTPGKVIPVVVEYEEELNPQKRKECIKEIDGYRQKFVDLYAETPEDKEEVCSLAKDLATKVKKVAEQISRYETRGNLHDECSKLYDALERFLKDLGATVSTEEGEDSSESGTKRKGGKWQRYAVIISGLCAVCLLACFLYNDLRPNPMPAPPKEDSVAIADSGRDSKVVDKSLQAGKDRRLDTLVARYKEAIQANNWSVAIESFNQIYNEYVGKNARKVRECEDMLDNKFENLIRNNDFEAASEWRNISLLSDSTKVYRNSFLERLKSSFKTYIKSNKNNFSKKEELIAKINHAKDNEYGYDGINADSTAIEKLSSPSLAPSPTKYQLAIYLEGSETASDTPFSTDTISLVVKKQYKIKNLNWVENAAFVKANPPKGIDYFVGGKGKEAYVQLKASSEASDGTLFEVEYRNGGNTLFKLHFKVVKRPRGIK